MIDEPAGDFEDQALGQALEGAMARPDAPPPAMYLASVRRRRRSRAAARMVFSGSVLAACVLVAVWLTGTPQNPGGSGGSGVAALNLMNVGAHGGDRISPAAPGGRLGGALPRAGMGPAAAAAAGLVDL